MTLKLYNTLSREKETFTPQDPKHVTMYVCGPTVYNYAHIGNGRSAVAFDLLFRVLRHHYGEDNVVYARNITDVDDKINKAAIEQKVDISVITRKFEKIYQDDLKALGNLPPSIEPRATETIDTIISMLERLIEAGHAYEADGHVLFNVPSYKDYGQLSRASQDEILAGARIEVASYKKDPSDFVLWKPSTPELPGWESPWGIGRPGWHIECSAMIEKHLGETIDIHCGGGDLTFPHHENEIAQSTCAHDGNVFAHYWLHNGFLTMGSEKMSKSLGNVLLIHDMIQEHPPEAVRLALLSAQYRQPLTWSDDLINQSINNLDKLYKRLGELTDIDAEPAYHPSILEALDNDLNTPQAFAALFSLLKDTTISPQELKSYLLGAGDLIGILQQTPEEWFTSKKQSSDLDEATILSLIDARKTAKAEKDFAKADQIRDDLIQQGIGIKDSPEGTTWHYL